MAVKMIPKTMVGATLPGNSSVEMKEFEIPKPGHGEVLIQTKATTICGSDIRCIYREHVGKGPEGYIPGLVAGHEPCGVIVEEGTPGEVFASSNERTQAFLGRYGEMLEK